MLQIGGFVFYEDVYTGKQQVKHCTRSAQHAGLPLMPLQSPLTSAPLPTSAITPLEFISLSQLLPFP